MSFHKLSAWLSQTWCPRRPPLVSLHLEELEHRTVPSVTVVPQQFSTNQYTALNITQSQLLAGDTGSAALAVSNPTQPANASLVDNHNGTFTFTPNDGSTGSTTFQYTVSPGQSQLTAANGNSSDGFGSAVAIDGDTAVVGAYSANDGTGTAYVFVLSGSTWVQQAELTASDGTASDFFGISVSVSGDTAVIGAAHKTGSSGGPFESGSARAGAAYVFVRSGSTWSQQAELTASDGAAFDTFGTSVSVSGDTAVIGAPGKTANSDSQHGAAYVFVRSGSTWSQQAELTVSDNSEFGSFGFSVAVNGDTVVVSGDVGSSFPAEGVAYVFVRSGSTWSQQAELTASDGAEFREGGSNVAIDGDTVVVSGDAGTSAPQGAAYVFVRSGTAWTQQAELTAADGPGGEDISPSVALSGDTAVLEGSKTYVFVRSGSTWSQQEEIARNGPVALSGETVLVGGQEEAFVQDLGTATATATVQVNPATAELSVSPASLSAGTEGQTYPSPTFTATGGAGSGYTFQESGILPPGLTFDAATAQFVGSPTQFGTYPGIVIAASDGQGGSGSQTYTLTVNHFGVNGLPAPFPQTIYSPLTSKSDPNADLDAFIRGLYHSVLDRDVESSSALTYWETIFTTVQNNPQQLGVAAGTDPSLYVTQGFWNSLEHRRDEVETYYQDFLGRTLDPNNSFDAAGLAYWINQFQFAGATEEVVIRGFLTSAEYLFKHQADASLANALNTNLLSGAATTADLQTWTSDLSALDAQRVAIKDQTLATPEDYKAQLSASLGALDDESAQTGVLFDMLSSIEYQQTALNSFYFAFLRRAGTTAEEQALLGLRDANGNPLSLGTIAEMMLASPEYHTNAVNSEVL